MTRARDYKAALEAIPAAPRVRDYRVAFTGDAYTPPAKPRVRDYAISLSGAIAVRVAHIPDRTVEPGTTVTIEASLIGGTVADSWTFRRVTGPSIGIEGSGATRHFVAPSAMPPDGTAVTIGVTATLDGITSPEQRVTITCLPQLRWVWTGSAWVGANRNAVMA